VPSKSLLVPPYPENLAVVEICEACNTSFSGDEEYFSAFLSAVLSNSVEPSEQKLAIGKRIFERNEPLKRRIEKARMATSTPDGDSFSWRPEIERVKAVLVKNARGHVFFENGEPAFDEPDAVECCPLDAMDDRQLDEFWARGGFAIWPEVGSRWMQRLVEGDNFDTDGFLVVQPGIYRFRVEIGPGITVRSVIHEYLSAVVRWN
jgi:hypothetical protein